MRYSAQTFDVWAEKLQKRIKMSKNEQKASCRVCYFDIFCFPPTIDPFKQQFTIHFGLKSPKLTEVEMVNPLHVLILMWPALQHLVNFHGITPSTKCCMGVKPKYLLLGWSSSYSTFPWIIRIPGG